MKHSGFLKAISVLVVSLLSATGQADQAMQYEEVKRIHDQVHAFLLTEYEQRFKSTREDDEVEITISNLDTRLRLPFCKSGMQTKMASSGFRGNHVTVRVRCDDGKPWSIFVPAKVDVISDVVVFDRSLARGTVIAEEDLRLIRMGTASVGHSHFNSLEQVVGMETKRAIQAGSPVRQSAVRAATVVKKGDKVVLEAGNRAFSVIAPGQALADGHVGKQIRVKNTETQRVVEARIVAPGKAIVAY